MITEMQNLDLDIEDQGHQADYVGVNIKGIKDSSIELSQWALIDTIIQDADLNDSNVKAVPAKVNEHLHAHLDKPSFSLNFNYRSMVGILNYLAQTTRPDIMYATNQLAKYSSNPLEQHGEAALYLVGYLKKSRDKEFEYCCNADFFGLWNKQFAHHNPITAKSRSGCFFLHAVQSSEHQTSNSGCSVDNWCWIHSDVSIFMWCSSQHVPHLGNEGERFSSLLHATIRLLQSLWKQFRCFRACSAPEATPTHQTYQHVLPSFLRACATWVNKIFPIGTKDQTAEVLTKALPQNDFQCHRRHMCGQWVCSSHHCEGVCNI